MSRRAPEPLRLLLRPAARRDLSEIWDFTAASWSPAQADAYLGALRGAMDLLCAAPDMARERTEFRPPLRLHPCRSHLIAYRWQGDALEVIRILHARRDWAALLSE